MIILPLSGDVCPYSVYCLQFYLIYPLYHIGLHFGLAHVLAIILAMAIPILILNCLVKVITSLNRLNLVKHTPDHPHHWAITMSVCIRSTILGILLACGISLILGDAPSHSVPLGFYLILLSFFHFSEYFLTSLTNPTVLGPDSFLIDNNIAYLLAISFSLVEFGAETYLYPGFKKFNIISLVGLTMAISGEFVRKLAIITAGKHFSHAIMERKDPHHKLVTHGIYSLSRHPSYAGWFYWAIGTQILLLNPFCVILFAVVSYNFFKDRIIYEESTLVNFFGNDYTDYKQRVGLWMPIRV